MAINILGVIVTLGLFGLLIVAWKKTETWEYRMLGAIIVTVALIIFIGLVSAPWFSISLQLRWGLIVAAMISFIMSVGLDKTKRVDGVFIDSRKKISLSYFQIALWTILALSSWTTIALHRIQPIINGELKALRVLVEEGLEESAATDDMSSENIKTSLLAALQKFLGEEGVDILDTTELKSLYTMLTGSKEFPESCDAIPDYDPLNIRFPEELLLAMGISTISLAGGAIIKTNKSHSESGKSLKIYKNELIRAEMELASAEKDVTGDAKKDALEHIEKLESRVSVYKEKIASADETNKQSLEETKKVIAEQWNNALISFKEVTDREDNARKRVEELIKAGEQREGLNYVNDTIEEAKWSDIFSGETVNDYQLVSMAKVQMFFFTIIIISAYASLIFAQMSTEGSSILLWIMPEMTLPVFSDSLVALLGISHAGYLAVKSTS